MVGRSEELRRRQVRSLADLTTHICAAGTATADTTSLHRHLMRPLARQSARLVSTATSTATHVRSSSCPRIRPVSLPAHPPSHRAFTTSLHPRSDIRPPSGPSEHPDSFEQRARRGETTTEPALEAESEDAEAKTSTEGKKPSMRRTMRHRRATDLPKPPPVPAWFLRHNVMLYVDTGLTAVADGAQSLKCVDAATGHTLFSVPYYVPLPKPSLPAQGNETRDAKKRRGSSADASKAPLDSSFFSSKVIPHDAPSASLPTPDPSSPRLDPLSYLMLELEASIRAGLSLSSALPSVSFAASRVDLSLLCPDPNSHAQLDQLVSDLAGIVQADVIRLDANDFEELTNEYVGQGRDGPGCFGTLGYDVFDGWEASSSLGGRAGNGLRFGKQADEDDEFDMEEDEHDEDEDVSEEPSSGFGNMDDLRKALHGRRHELGKALQGIGIAGITIGSPKIMSMGTGGMPMGLRKMAERDGSDDNVPAYLQFDDARLGALLDNLLDAAKLKRKDLSTTSESQHAFDAGQPLGEAEYASHQLSLREQRSNRLIWATNTAGALVSPLEEHPSSGQTSLGNERADTTLQLVPGPPSTANHAATDNHPQRTIIHVRDLKDLLQSRTGDVIIKSLVRVVQKRRRTGEHVIILGTGAVDTGPFSNIAEAPEGLPFRTMTVPPFFKYSSTDEQEFLKSTPRLPTKGLEEGAVATGHGKLLEINLRHVQSMLRRLHPGSELENMNLLSKNSRRQMDVPGTSVLAERVLSYDQIQRIVLAAIGLSKSHLQAEAVAPVHIGLAISMTARVDAITKHWSMHFRDGMQPPKSFRLGGTDSGAKGEKEKKAPSRVEEVRPGCNAHETRLLTGVVDSANIKTGFGDVHAPDATIEALKTLTTLSLLRPEAFKYGVLANDRLPGLLLYGPPGTGKTLLAKAVAKESQATVLEVSGAQIYEKYVGEGEKMVRAVFSLAAKLSPCVVFIDEADAIFGSRSGGGGGNRNTHREIINQFLREWDGMDDRGVFVMVASNRPFDLDDAVLRRLPRRLLVDLPVAKDRESILKIHLKNEMLDDSVALGILADQTPLYSGSDLKNLCVAAALACVREENTLLSEKKKGGDEDFALPEKRTLSKRHFDTATREISASISEDMGSLGAIRKFDEQFGDRGGRRKKSSLGFGMAGDGEVDENSVLVRPSPVPASIGEPAGSSPAPS